MKTAGTERQIPIIKPNNQRYSLSCRYAIIHIGVKGIEEKIM
jgi:hypothetical protein